MDMMMVAYGNEDWMQLEAFVAVVLHCLGTIGHVDKWVVFGSSLICLCLQMIQ